MGLERLALSLIALTWLQFCDTDDSSEAEVPAIEGEVSVAAVPEVAVDVVVPEPSAGGTMVTVGPHPLEVSPYGDGTVIAYVRSPEPPPPSSTQVTVRVPADDGERHAVLLVWDPAGGHYRGRLRGVHPVPGPVEVALVAGEHRYAGTGPRVVIVAPAAPSPVEVEAPAPAVEVQAPSAPRVAVEVNAPQPPRPRVEVQVERPRAPRHEVVVRHPGPPRPAVRVSRRGRSRARTRRRRRGRRARVRIRH